MKISPMIGKAITYFREGKDITQSKLSEMTGISNSSINSYESLKRNPSMKNLSLIADALNTTVETLQQTAESFEAIKENFIDKKQIDRHVHHLQRRHNVLMELSDRIFLGIRVNAHDVVQEITSGRSFIGPHKKSTPVEALVEKVVQELLEENIEEISNRLQKEISQTVEYIDDIINNLKNN